MNASLPTFSSPGALTRYDPRTIALHWATAGLVIALWLLAQVIDWFPAGPARIDCRSVHIVLGIILAIVLVRLIVWRRLAGNHLPSAGPPALARLASIVQVLLYVLLVVEVLLGLANVWVRGDSIFNLFAIPSFAPGDRALRRQINGYHQVVANTILVLAGFHAMAALLHHYYWKDEVLRRMWPSRKYWTRSVRE